MVDPFERNPEWVCSRDGHIFERGVCVWCNKKGSPEEIEAYEQVGYGDEPEETNVEDY